METAAIETRHSTRLTDAVIWTRASALYCPSVAARYCGLRLSDKSALERKPDSPLFAECGEVWLKSTPEYDSPLLNKGLVITREAI